LRRRDVAIRTPSQPHDEWLSLDEASKRLGVHPTTLRRWANEGSIEVFVTPGGHRRFSSGCLQRFQAYHQRQLPAQSQQRWVDQAIAQTRQQIPGQMWVAAYGEPDREAQRQLGRMLVGLTLQYVARSDDAPELLSEARRLGTEHAKMGQGLGRSLSDLLQAISFFRTTLLEGALLGLPLGVSSQPETSLRLLRRIEALLNEIQAGVVELYCPGRRNQ